MNVVVDANVLAAANFHAAHADLSCIEHCIVFLTALKNDGGCVSMDQGGLIFQEYGRYANHKGEPGIGDAFFRWLFDHQGYPEICEQVIITIHPTLGFAEFPADARLQQFDPADRKYVAVALASQHRPIICNATDSDWQNDQVALTANGVQVRELCI